MTRSRFEDIDSALASARRRLEEIGREGRLSSISTLRDYAPDERVHARIEISGPGLIRSSEAGVDLMGDGNLVAYSGSIRKDALPAGNLEEAFSSIRRALT